jgi:hypothetical protein
MKTFNLLDLSIIRYFSKQPNLGLLGSVHEMYIFQHTWSKWTYFTFA